MAKKSGSGAEDFEQDLFFLRNLVVGIGEVSEITKIPTRKIRYWEEKGIITSLTEEEGKNRRYDYKNIKKMLLVQELLEEGFTLEAAAEKVEKRIVTINQAFEKFSKGVKGK